ncbi:Formate/nitrite transporter [Favolaschia claudopus]|uniref:Formate/nitrite transporter n=1 Tax=Favolaschia claudopus TaxID=2862362 RepID=A0AAW0AAB5_9AGAR
MDPSTLRPTEVAAYFLKAGVAKHNDRYDYVFFKAVIAGVMLSFGGLLSEVISGGSPALTQSNPGLVKILGGFVFPVGLVMCVLVAWLALMCLIIFPMAVLKRVIPWWSLPINFIIVTFGNLVGSLFFGAILVKYSGVMSAEPYATFVKSFAIKKAAEPEWHQIFLRGIGCNWLVCVAVWQAAGAKETISKIYAIWIPIWIFVACSFDHGIPLGIMFGADLTVAEYIRKSLIASYLGNIVGALLVALPANYFWLRDFEAGGLRNAEAAVARDGTPSESLDDDKKR